MTEVSKILEMARENKEVKSILTSQPKPNNSKNPYMAEVSKIIEIAREKREVKSILISQPKPNNSKNPYTDLAEKYNVKIDFRKFIQIEGITGKEFRKTRVNPIEYSAVIFTSKMAIEHFFRICGELRITMPQDTKYFCSSEVIALYLQNFIEYRKRKVFFKKDSKTDLFALLEKHKGEKYLYPCASYPFEDVRKNDIPNFLKEKGIDFTESTIYRIVCSDLSDLEDIFYDMIVFFTPLGIRSLFKNFPDFKQNNTRIAAFGPVTLKAILDHNLIPDVKAPSPEAKSMKDAIGLYLKEVNPQ